MLLIVRFFLSRRNWLYFLAVLQALYTFDYDFIAGVQSGSYQIFFSVVQVEYTDLGIFHRVVRLQTLHELFVLDFYSSRLWDADNVLHIIRDQNVGSSTTTKHMFLVREDSTHANRTG